ncbi:MAG: hypothetical protein MSH58_08730 [Clostridiales bacterium]|uniref:hypothetical protein n=1 Tax=Candidatus Ventrimonas sp. TaxID=3048889 RepID=UPI003FEE5745|nr:hypothetical protein [Clostridiales bacterium]
MRTGLTKKQKITNIYFTEADDLIEVCTYNTDLKKRLAAFAGKYPSECRPLDDDGNGCVTYEVRKGRLSFRLTAPYTEERKKAASEAAKKNTGNLKVAQD